MGVLFSCSSIHLYGGFGKSQQHTCTKLMPEITPRATHMSTHAAAGKVEKMERPTISAAGSSEDWAYFQSRWTEYVDATKGTDRDTVVQLLECCDDQLRKDLIRLTDKTEADVHEAIKNLQFFRRMHWWPAWHASVQRCLVSVYVDKLVYASLLWHVLVVPPILKKFCVLCLREELLMLKVNLTFSGIKIRIWSWKCFNSLRPKKLENDQHHAYWILMLLKLLASQAQSLRINRSYFILWQNWSWKKKSPARMRKPECPAYGHKCLHCHQSHRLEKVCLRAS